MKLFMILLMFVGGAVAQELPSRWDELTASDWPKTLEKSASTCILPIGILEKHGPHAPIGSNFIKENVMSALAMNTKATVISGLRYRKIARQ
jgi:creatinine amidohydrolase